MVCGWGEDTLPIMSSTGESQQPTNTNDVSLETINLLGTLFAGVRWLAIGAWGREVAGSISPLVPAPGTGVAYAVAAAAVVSLGALWFTGDRLRSFTLRGDE